MAVKGINKAGPVTFAVGLIGAGLTLLLYNLGAVTTLGWMWKLWPLLLIGIGVEYFIKKALHREDEVHFHVPSIILILILILVGGTAYATTNVGPNLDRILDGMPWYNEDRMTYARSWESEAVPVNAGDRLMVENNLGLIEFLPAEGGELSVRAVIRAPESGPVRNQAEQVEPEIIQEGGLITVKVPDTRSGDGPFNRVVTDLSVYVPTELAIEVLSGTGRVVAGGLDNDLKLDGNTGSVEFKNMSGRVEVRNNTGRIEIKNPGGDVKAQTNTGSIEMTSDRALGANYELTSNTGRVYLQMPGDSNLKINAVSRTGNVSVTGLPQAEMRRDGARAEYNHTMGEGKGVADLEVGTGSVQIIVQ
ncbi:MAG: hypothetical protein JL56_14765 [Desulfotomaculum sp. BICA1-6]|nr:MAG: hypothetical protein VR67_09020 [Peptococcaceae bacterium BRH_c8a]KJS71497.1 MAG: hypothetical protein JL56_14765 [Desulfotomaculum sp. BICA1-6]